MSRAVLAYVNSGTLEINGLMTKERKGTRKSERVEGDQKKERRSDRLGLMAYKNGTGGINQCHFEWRRRLFSVSRELGVSRETPARAPSV